jgi:hypothetical protein
MYIDRNAHILGWRVLRSIGQVDLEVVGDHQTKAAKVIVHQYE